jgi:hypothetical protein
MCRDKRIHERLKVGPPPLRQSISDFPVLVDALAAELSAYWSQSFIESLFEAVNLFVFGFEVVSWPGIEAMSVQLSTLHSNRYHSRGRDIQFEERVCNLQHQNMRMVVLVTDEDPLTGPPHPMLLIVLFQSSKTGQHRRIFLGLCFFGAKCVI